MPIYDVRVNSKMLRDSTKSQWKDILYQWQNQVDRICRSLLNLESAACYNEMGHVGILASAVHNTLYKNVVTLVERPIDKDQLDGSIKPGRLDLWIDFESSPRFDCSVEAKLIRLTDLSMPNLCNQILNTLEDDIHCLNNLGGFSNQKIAIAFLILESDIELKQNELDEFEENLWRQMIKQQYNGKMMTSHMYESTPSKHKRKDVDLYNQCVILVGFLI